MPVARRRASQPPPGRIIRIEPARSIRAGRIVGARYPAWPESDFSLVTDDVVIGSGDGDALMLSGGAGTAAAGDVGTSVIAASRPPTIAWPPAIQNAAAVTAHSARANPHAAGERPDVRTAKPRAFFANTPSRSRGSAEVPAA